MTSMQILMRRILGVLCAFLLTQQAVWASDYVLLEGDLLSVSVENRPLKSILAQLSSQGIEVRIDPRINPQITAKFEKRPIDAALSAMLRSFDYALVWHPRKNPSESGQGHSTLAEIQIFYPGESSRATHLRPNPNLDLIFSRDGIAYVRDTLLLRTDAQMSEEQFGKLLQMLDAASIEVVLPGIVRLQVPAGTNLQTAIARLQTYPGIAHVEPDYAFALAGTQPAAMEPTLLSTERVDRKEGKTAIAVLDSGLQPDYQTSPYVLDSYNALSPGESAVDTNGHGTQMTLIATGAVDPLGVQAGQYGNSPVYAIQTFDDNGYTSNATLIRAIDYALSQGVSILSLSWGTQDPSPLLESAINSSVEQGLVVVAAAGNTPSGLPVYPAAYEQVIGVGALGSDGKPWEQSNFGDFVHVQAPGIAFLPTSNSEGPGVYAGTSIATAYTARRIAAILDEQPDADRETIIRLLNTESN